MKFYIFGNRTNETKIVSSAKKANYQTYDLEEALSVFKQYIDEVRFTNIYLLVDFEVKKRPIFGSENIENDLDEILPFFILGEWHIGEDPNEFIRADHTEIDSGGFNHSFENNLDALRLFLGFMENGRTPRFTVIYIINRKLLVNIKL